MSATPTSLSLAHLRDLGYLVEVVEKWNPHSRTRSDLFGMFDLLGIGSDGEVIAVQCTSDSNVSARVRKIAEHVNISRARQAGWMLIVHGWAKKGRPARWSLRTVDVS